MRLWPEEFAEVEPNLQRAIELLLQLIEEVVCGPQGIVTGGPGVEEAKARILRAWERRDKKAEDAAIKDCMRAQLRESWQTFPEPQLLIDLYQRAARRWVPLVVDLSEQRKPPCGEWLPRVSGQFWFQVLKEPVSVPPPSYASPMGDSERQRRPKHSGRTGPELRVTRVNFNTGPDAEDRLRRLFTMLVKLAVKDDRPPPRTDSSTDDEGQADG